MDSVESYVYSVLGAQANQQHSIVSDAAGGAIKTQQSFRKIANATMVQTDVDVAPNNMRTAIRDTNVTLNMAINPDIILIPSRLIILEKTIPGYNNILKVPIKTTAFGVNTILNYVGVKKTPPLKKHSPDSTPVHHLDTLDDKKILPTIHEHKDEKVRPKVSEDNSNGILAGIGIGSVAVFLLFKVLL